MSPKSKTTIWMPSDLWKRVKRSALDADTTAQKWMEEAARAKLVEPLRETDRAIARISAGMAHDRMALEEKEALRAKLERQAKG